MGNSPNGFAHDLGVDPSGKHVNGLRGFGILGQFLEQDDWHPQQIEGKYVYSMFYNGKNGTLRCYAQVRVDLEQFIFYVYAPIKAEGAARQAVGEYITRANYGMRIGNFEFDFGDGEIRYKSSFDFEGELITFNFIRHAIYPAIQTMDYYLPGLMSVIYGGKTALEAIKEMEESER